MELEERIRLTDVCASLVEYLYHMLKVPVLMSLGSPRARDLFGISHIMSEEECWRVVAVEKHLEESRVTQTTREVLRLDAEALRERAKQTVVRLLKDLNTVNLEQEQAKETAAELLAKLEVMKAEWDEALHDAKGVISAKRDLKRALGEAKGDATGLCLQKLNAKSSIHRLSDEGECTREEVSKLSSELDAVRAKAATHRG
ncbi:hypothetical protein ACLOJK_004085 [Asimina triloba]